MVKAKTQNMTKVKSMFTFVALFSKQNPKNDEKTNEYLLAREHLLLMALIANDIEYF